MPVRIPRGPSASEDPSLGPIVQGLEGYLRDHPAATVEVYRRGKYLVRVRVVDPAFAGLTDAARVRAVWAYLGHLPDEAAGDVSFMATVTPGESDDPLSREFDTPTPIDGPPGWFDMASGSVRMMATGGLPPNDPRLTGTPSAAPTP